MSTIDEGELDRLEGLYAAATPGEWRYRPDRYDDWGFVRAEDGSIALRGYPGHDVDEAELDEHRRQKTDPHGPNALFAVAAHESFPALLAAARALSAEKAAREEAERKLSLARAAKKAVRDLLTAEIHRAAALEAKLTTAEAESARLRERVKEMEEALGGIREFALEMVSGCAADIQEGADHSHALKSAGPWNAVLAAIWEKNDAE